MLDHGVRKMRRTPFHPIIESIDAIWSIFSTFSFELHEDLRRRRAVTSFAISPFSGCDWSTRDLATADPLFSPFWRFQSRPQLSLVAALLFLPSKRGVKIETRTVWGHPRIELAH